ncbi:acetyl-CoA carboxylase biotin carboxyl carrier protein [Bauldia litoralis]|uniref:Biotin carboxyl carrier protein of acetyl-CoA carboxylase n=1 Tax=Bauldia litoralis TaxID=665467 RepID=A0A1G6D7I1_9HYPH|nr:acetyl-CoA carboxylase biotin carboxyl carrier protein [Bauldia litoralis]SDB41071.1 acetyl-CoA carboxylase biotin carboxyl carrier protein [Bauldia litoralis]
MNDKKKIVDHDLIRELSKLLTETDLTEIELEDGDMRIRVARSPAPVTAVAPAAAAPAPAEPSHRQPAAAPDDPAANPGALLSPMVGTAYLSSEPGARPYVDIGESVREGQTVMIVEAMKTMNQIPATRSGTVTRILVEDGQPVEYGEPLMIIE